MATWFSTAIFENENERKKLKKIRIFFSLFFWHGIFSTVTALFFLLEHFVVTSKWMWTEGELVDPMEHDLMSQVGSKVGHSWAYRVSWPSRVRGEPFGDQEALRAARRCVWFCAGKCSTKGKCVLCCTLWRICLPNVAAVAKREREVEFVHSEGFRWLLFLVLIFVIDVDIDVDIDGFWLCSRWCGLRKAISCRHCPRTAGDYNWLRFYGNLIVQSLCKKKGCPLQTLVLTLSLPI